MIARADEQSELMVPRMVLVGVISAGKVALFLLKSLFVYVER